MSSAIRTTDVAVVGASIAGVLAALGLRRRGLSVALFEHFLDNCALESILEIPSTPTTMRALPGVEYAELVRGQIESAGVVEQGIAVRISLSVGAEGVSVENVEGTEIRAKRLVYSPFGVESGLPWLSSVEALAGRGVSKDAWSDASFFQGEPVAVVGAGRRAAEQALIAASYGGKPTIFCPWRRFDSQGLGELLRSSAVRVQEATAVKGLTADVAGHLAEAVTIDEFGRETAVRIKGLFLAQGLVSDWSIFGVNHEPIHPMVQKAGLAGGIPYWNYAAHVQDGAVLGREMEV